MVTQRGQQPKCGRCNHASSFHGMGKTRCRVLHCECSQWRKPKDIQMVPENVMVTMEGGGGGGGTGQ